MQLFSSTNANRIALTQNSQSTTTMVSSNHAKDANPKSYTQNQSVDRPRERPRTCKIRHPLASCPPGALVLGGVYPWADCLLKTHRASVRELFGDGEGVPVPVPTEKKRGENKSNDVKTESDVELQSGYLVL